MIWIPDSLKIESTPLHRSGAVRGDGVVKSKTLANAIDEEPWPMSGHIYYITAVALTDRLAAFRSTADMATSWCWCEHGTDHRGGHYERTGMQNQTKRRPCWCLSLQTCRSAVYYISITTAIIIRNTIFTHKGDEVITIFYDPLINHKETTRKKLTINNCHKSNNIEAFEKSMLRS